MTDKLHFDDLTQITCPFGLLDEDTQERLRAHGGPYEYFTDFDDGWVTNPHLSFPMFVRSLAYRAAPAKPCLLVVKDWSMLADWVSFDGGFLMRIRDIIIDTVTLILLIAMLYGVLLILWAARTG